MTNQKPFSVPAWNEEELKNGNKFELVPIGEAELTVLDVYPTTFSTGKNGVIFMFEDHLGRQLKHQCMNDVDKTGKMNRWQLKNTLQAITGEDPQSGDVTIDPRKLIGKLIRANILHEEVWSDKHQRNFPKAKIESFLQSGQTGGATKPASISTPETPEKEMPVGRLPWEKEEEEF